MKRDTLRLSYLTLLILSLSRCDSFSEKINSDVENAVSTAKTEMVVDIKNLKRTFASRCDSATSVEKDSSRIETITRFEQTTNHALRYSDSLRHEMAGLRDDDFNNNNKIKSLFLDAGAGDSLFRMVRESYKLAIELSFADTTKRRLNENKEKYSSATMRQLFGLNSPSGTNMVLYGIQSELLTDCNTALK
jgi:hypothetical protein